MKEEIQGMTYAVQEEEQIQIPVKQYTEAIMAMQKLNDIKNIAHVEWEGAEECAMVLATIKAITG